MATVRMKKGSKYADIFDSPETIKQARLDGYVLVEKKIDSASKPDIVNSGQTRHETKTGSR